MEILGRDSFVKPNGELRVVVSVPDCERLNCGGSFSGLVMSAAYASAQEAFGARAFVAVEIDQAGVDPQRCCEYYGVTFREKSSARGMGIAIDPNSATASYAPWQKADGVDLQRQPKKTRLIELE